MNCETVNCSSNSNSVIFTLTPFKTQNSQQFSKSLVESLPLPSPSPNPYSNKALNVLLHSETNHMITELITSLITATKFIRIKFKNFINNSWAKHKGNHNRGSVFKCDKSTCVFSQNFCLKFFGLYNNYIENSFANKLTRWVSNGSFLKLFKILAIRALSNIKRSAAPHVLYLIKPSCSYIK